MTTKNRHVHKTTPNPCPSTHGERGFAPGSYAITWATVACGICGKHIAITPEMRLPFEVECQIAEMQSDV